MLSAPDIPKKYRPRGIEILHEDADIIIGNKSAGILTVAALWEKKNTVEENLNSYVRKGSPHSKKRVFVVHRLDQATSGILIFAKSTEVQAYLKDNWKSTEKTYYAVVHGKLNYKSDIITSHLVEDEDYVVKSTQKDGEGKLAQTEYQVVFENSRYSVLKINLLTGKKNQIRVHLSEAGHPLVGDPKYGATDKSPHLMLHAFALTLTHPFKGKRLRAQADVPEYFKKIVDYEF
jgi:RluA family pseudouridine synthase